MDGHHTVRSPAPWSTTPPPPGSPSRRRAQQQGAGNLLRVILIVMVLGSAFIAWFLLRGYKRKDD